LTSIHRLPHCILTLFTALFLLLAGTPPANSQAAAAPKGAYRLQAGDEIAVAVSPQKGYDGAGIVLPDGVVYLRKVGKLRAVGLTLDELQEAIRKVLNEELVDPEVLVTLTKMAPPPPEPSREPIKIGKIAVVGGVVKTGPLDLEEGLRVRRALDLAGGTVKEADLANILIIHKDLTRSIVDLSNEERVSDPAHNRVLKDGDSIEVKLVPVVEKRTPMVRIRGQVITPGQYELKAGMTLEDLIIAAGRLTTLADVEAVQLQPAGGAVRTVNLFTLQEQGLNGKIFLKEGDEVFVPQAENRVLVVGAVDKPGPRSFKPGQKLRDFLLLSQQDATAFNPANINLPGAEIIRRGDKAVTKVNLREVLKTETHKDNLELQNGDVLFLPPKRGPRKSILDTLGPVGWMFGLFL
jgi:protein involved in polysaccharide export with SLBB domain